MLASEYSSMCSAGVELRNSPNIRRRPAISSSDAFSVAMAVGWLRSLLLRWLGRNLARVALQDAHDVISPSRLRRARVAWSRFMVSAGVMYLIYQKPPPGYEQLFSGNRAALTCNADLRNDTFCGARHRICVVGLSN